MIDLAMPALRSMSLSQAKIFRKNVKSLIDADDRVSLFEFTVQRILDHHLDPVYLGSRVLPIRFHDVIELIDDCKLVLSTLAHVGHDSEKAARKAFTDGSDRLHCGSLEMLPESKCSRLRLDKTLDRLVLASPELKKTILTAFAHAVASDGQLREDEAELLRAVSDAMGCPMPPILLAAQPVPVEA